MLIPPLGYPMRPGGVAAGSGMLEAGDEILNVNGREGSLCTAHELCSLVLGPAGTQVDFKLMPVVMEMP